MLLPRLLRTSLVVLAFGVTAVASADAETFEHEGLRFEVPDGFARASQEAEEMLVVAAGQSMLASLPWYYDKEKAEFRAFTRVRPAEQLDVLVLLRVPGESRCADDPLLWEPFCRGVRDLPQHDPQATSCGLQTTRQGLPGVDVHVALSTSSRGVVTECLFLFPRRDDVIFVVLALAGDHRAEADALWRPLLDSLQNDRSLPPPRVRNPSGALLQQLLLIVVAPGLVLGLGWVWWRRRRTPAFVPRSRRGPRGPRAGLT